MKKNCIIFVFVVIAVMAFVLFSNYKTLKNRNTWNKNIFTQCNKMPEEKILCVSNDSAVHLFDNNKSHAYISNNILDILKDAPVKFLGYHKAFEILYPIVFDNFIFLFKNTYLDPGIIIFHNAQTYEKLYIGRYSLHCVTFPEIENDKAIFFIIRSESMDFEKEIYFLEKITFDGAVIENKIISQIEVPDNVSFSRRYSEVSFFTVKNDMVSFIGLDGNKGSYIFNFSMNGKLLEKGAPAEIFIPNNYDNSTYYVANNTSEIITERSRYSDNNSLYKDGNKLFDIPYPINQGYFYSPDSIYLLFYDRTESQKFDFINGLSDRPSLYSYFYDTQSNNFIPMYFKYPWKDGFFTYSFITDDYVNIIPFCK